MSEPDQQRSDPAASVHAKGEVRVDVDAVTPREFYGALAKIEEKISRQKIYIVILAAAVFSPKVGGPSPSELITAFISHVA